MKVALLHDWIVAKRGGERILEALVQLFPKATIYTLIHEKGSSFKAIENSNIKSTFFSWLQLFSFGA